jgi:hypothetical protein
MDPLDGNVIGGDLLTQLGREMTDARGACRHCGTASLIGELVVYAKAPGAVARCRTCGQVVIVVLQIRDEVRVDLAWFELFPPELRAV